MKNISRSAQHALIKKQATRFGYKSTAIIMPCCSGLVMPVYAFIAATCSLFLEQYIAHLQQECHNSKFDIFELLV